MNILVAARVGPYAIGFEASRLFRRAIDINPQQPAYFPGLARALQLGGHLEEARAAYEQAVDRIPGDAEPHIEFSNVLTDLGRHAEALTVIERSVANYGMINLRTDGVNVLSAQRLEKARSKKARWDVHMFEPDQNNRLKYVSKRH